LSHVGLREGDSREYTGARNAKFVLAPGSALTKRPPRWIVVAELVETSRLYGRIGARIEPESVERIAADLVQRSYSEPHWDAGRGAVMAYERVTLYGLPLVARRRVGYATVDAQLSRELFIRHALVERDWESRHDFLRTNAKLYEDLAELEDQARRRDLLVGDDEMYALYDARIPPDVVSARHFDAWWKKQRHVTPDLLTFNRDDLLRREDSGEHPRSWRSGELDLPLSYRFAPGEHDDGVTVHVPVGVLANLDQRAFSWQVPALREELVTALIKSLPKPLRRNFAPVADSARAVLAAIGPGDGALLETLLRELHRRTGVLVPLAEFDPERLPAHLRVTFAVENADGSEMARGKNLDELQRRLAGPARAAVAQAVAADLQRTGLRTWPEDVEVIPRTVEHTINGHLVRGFPAFADAGATVDLRVFATPFEQDAAMGRGIRRLLRLSAPSPAKAVERQLDSRARLMLGNHPDGSLAALIDDCADAATDRLAPVPVWSRAEFAALRDRVAAALAPTTLDVVGGAAKVLMVCQAVRMALPDKPMPTQSEALADIRAQLRALFPGGFVAATGAARLADLSRYITAVGLRLERLPRDVAGDGERMQRVHAVMAAYAELMAALPAARTAARDVADIAWQIEEFRVSLWAQQLGTPRPVSEQRIYRAIDAVDP
jgi:ATP-dependent helicase HrpA